MQLPSPRLEKMSHDGLSVWTDARLARQEGVVVAFSAFNHPLNLIVHQVGPAIAAGCPAIVKPAQDSGYMCIVMPLKI